MFSLAFFLVILHICAYFIRCLSSLFSIITHRFFIRARAGDDILEFSGLLIALAAFDALCWIMYVMVSLMETMSSSSGSASNRFLNSSWNSITLIVLVYIYSCWTLGHYFSVNFYVQLDVARTHYVFTSNVDMVDDCYVCDDVSPFVRL